MSKQQQRSSPRKKVNKKSALDKTDENKRAEAGQDLFKDSDSDMSDTNKNDKPTEEVTVPNESSSTASNQVTQPTIQPEPQASNQQESNQNVPTQDKDLVILRLQSQEKLEKAKKEGVKHAD